MVYDNGGRRIFGAHWAFAAFFVGVAGYHLVSLITTAAVTHQGSDDESLGLLAGPALLLAFVPNLVLGLSPVVGSLRFGFGLECDFGLRPSWRDVRIGLACGALALVVGYLLNLGMLTVYGADDVSDSPLTDLPDVSEGSYTWLAAAAAVLIVAVPLTEELLVRGALWNALAFHRVPSWAVLTLTAFVFAQLHGESTRVIALFAQGLVLGLARYRSGRTAASVIAHATNNLPPAVLLFTGH